jgi:hypothetical protein
MSGNKHRSHAPGHLRETAHDAFLTWAEWDGEGPEPTVEYEIDYVPHDITISQACGLVWNCSDILEGDCFRAVEEVLATAWEPHPIKRQTYAAVAQAILKYEKQTKRAA